MIRTAARRDRLATAVLLGTAVLVWAAAAAGATLGGLRAGKRAALAAAAAADGAQHFRLLVIPVDFADARLPAAWDPSDLSARLSGPGATLEGWWSEASGGVLHLRTVQAPLVHLPGTRRDYSDRDLGGDLIRSRALATAALEATRAVLPLRLADGDGPDGLPAGADDDGEVDGVLLLHAGPGLENDPVDGLIQPLQAWLLEPVTDRGTTARLYAVASLHSGLGVWLHESAHLLGLEDRYDLALSGGRVDGETAARGGLGRFSLMAAGYDDAATAHLDAYSRIELGWTSPLRPLGPEVLLGPAWDRPVRLDLRGDPDAPASYYLLELVADPRRGAPALAVYHVDEAVPEDGQSSSDPDDRHLRVRLVEADGGDELARGQDAGAVGDLFPGDGLTQDWTAATTPATAPYGGLAFFELLGIAPADGGIVATRRALTGSWSLELYFTESSTDTTFQIHVEGASATAPESLALRVLDGSGTFDGRDALTAPLVPDGTRHRLALPLAWTPAPDLAAGEVTRLGIRVEPAGLDTVRTWSWGADGLGLDGWPTGWRGGTGAWSDWSAAPFAPAGATLVAATDAAASVSAWPDVSVGNGAMVEMISPPVPPGAWVELEHWYDLGPGPDGFPGDGAVVEHVLQDGRRLRAIPAGGYPGSVNRAAATSLAGDSAFAGPGELDDADAPLWRTDRFPPPESDRPYRLAFRLETDGLWSGRGWWLLSLGTAAAPGPGVLAPYLDADAWRWSLEGAPRVQLSGDGGASWTTVAAPAAPAYPVADLERDLAALGASRASLRIVTLADGRRRATRAVAVASARAADPLRPLAVWPSPARGGCRIHLQVPVDAAGPELGLYDLRGRRLRRWPLGPGDQVVAWDGRDAESRRLPAGRYLLRAELGDLILRRSVILLP